MLLTECIESCLKTTYPVFTGDDIVLDVLTFMQEGGFECVPLLQEGKLKAMVTILDLLPDSHAQTMPKPRLTDLHLQAAQSIGRHEHLFDVFSRIRLFPGNLIAVTDKDGIYAGIVEKVMLLEKIADVFHLTEEGITLELDVPAFDLKLSEVIAILEKNDVTVLSFGMYRATSDRESMVITFRLQTHDLFRLVKNMEKYGYLIRYASPFFKERDNELREKALEFIHFMDM